MPHTQIAHEPPVDVIILMGSDSDWESMVKCHELLTELGIKHDVHVASAHRTPNKVHRIVLNAPARHVKVFICAAGMAAHLAGAVAAHATCPVIGVPMPGGVMDGLDALLSTVQMPPGVPVATVGVGAAGAKNAAILAAQIIALSSPEVAQHVSAWRAKQTQIVEDKDTKLRASLKK
jgi:5-(carboxyamino)imidazole ribonucleotide mutase